MDDLTRERYPHGVPWREQYARPTRLVDDAVAARRIVLCGTADMSVLAPGGQERDVRRVARESRLRRVIRRWVA